MAKDQTALLQEISNQLKKMNASSVREKMQQQAMVERQEAILAGNPVAAGEGSILDPAEDFRRRIKGSLAAAIAAEKFTASGKRARRSNQEAKDDKKFNKLTKVKTGDKKVGLSDINTGLFNIKQNQLDSFALLMDNDNSNTMFQLGHLEDIAMVLHMQLDFWEDMLGDQRKEAMSNKRALLENNRETNKEKLLVQSAPILGLPAPSGSGGGMGLGTMALRALPALVIAGVVALAVGAITDFVTGWKEDGLAGAIGKGLGGAGEGVWNSIKQSFKVGGLGATIGGAIGFLFGGVGAIPGAIIGGLIGMAIGAVAGYFGGDKITEGLKEAGKAVSDAWEKTKYVFSNVVGAISNWIYTPGSQARLGNDAVKTTIFGGFISWDAGEFSIAAAWASAKKSLSEWAGKIGKFFFNEEEGTILGGLFDMPDWMLSLKNSVSKVWEGIKDFGTAIKNMVIGMLPASFTDYMGWTTDGKIVPKGSVVSEEALMYLKGLEPKAERFAELNAPNFGVTSPLASVKGFSLADNQGKGMIRKDENGEYVIEPLNLNDVPEVSSVNADTLMSNGSSTRKGNPGFGNKANINNVSDQSTNKGAITMYNSTYQEAGRYQKPGSFSNNSNGVVTASGEIWSW